MSVPGYRHVTGLANQINVTSVYRHTDCNCEWASDLSSVIFSVKIHGLYPLEGCS